MHGTYSEDTIFGFLNSLVPSVGNRILVNGRYWKTGQTVISWGERTASDTITLYGMDDGGNLRNETVVDGVSTNRTISIAV